jgi:hypothetical protein
MVENINTYIRTRNLDHREDKALFTIDNTKQIIMMDIFWYLFFVLFIFILWILVLYSDQSMGKTSKEIFLQEIYNPRFASVLVILLIIGPVATFLSIRKHLRQDNHLYFFSDRIEYQDRVVELSKIEAIKIGSLPLLKENIQTYFFIYVFAIWVVIPLRIYYLVCFFILKVMNKNNVENFSNRFSVLVTKNKPIAGAIYSAKEMANLKKFITDKRINNAR